MRLFAAGSLCSVLTSIIEAFAAPAGDGAIQPTYGPSGRLRQRMEQGDLADVFASADITHTDTLLAAGQLKDSRCFAGNQMALMAAPGFVLSPDRLVERMLDPAVRLGTSTPQADPAGDYAWAVFRRIDQHQPGAFAELSAKALQLMGQGRPTSPGHILCDEQAADIFLIYASEAAEEAQRWPGITWQALPPAYDVMARYGIGASIHADENAERLIGYVLGEKGQALLRQHGFLSVTQLSQITSPPP